MEIFKRYKCIKYGKDNEGMLFLTEHGVGFVMEDTTENRSVIEEEFNNWKNSLDDFGSCSCTTCWYKYECHYWN